MTLPLGSIKHQTATGPEVGPGRHVGRVPTLGVAVGSSPRVDASLWRGAPGSRRHSRRLARGTVEHQEHLLVAPALDPRRTGPQIDPGDRGPGPPEAWVRV